MIIEDETIIAMDLTAIVEGIARGRTEVQGHRLSVYHALRLPVGGILVGAPRN